MILLWGGLLCLIPFWKKFIQPLKWLLGYLLMVGCIEIAAKLYVYEWLEGNNLYLLHIYTPLEFALLAMMYFRIFSWHRHSKISLLLQIIFILVVAYSIAHLMGSLNGEQTFALYSKILVNGTMIGLSCAFFIQCLRFPGRFLHHFNAMGISNSGVLLYFAGSFIIYLILNQMINSMVSQVIYLWVINAILTFIFHLTCIIALWQKDSRQTKISRYG